MKRKSLFYMSATVLVLSVLAGYAVFGLTIDLVLSNTIYLEVHYQFVFESLESLKLYFLRLDAIVFDGWHTEFNGSVELFIEIVDDFGRLMNVTQLVLPLLDDFLFMFDSYTYPELRKLFVEVSASSFPAGYRLFTYGNESFMVSLEDAEVKT